MFNSEEKFVHKNTYYLQYVFKRLRVWNPVVHQRKEKEEKIHMGDCE